MYSSSCIHSCIVVVLLFHPLHFCSVVYFLIHFLPLLDFPSISLLDVFFFGTILLFMCLSYTVVRIGSFVIVLEQRFNQSNGLYWGCYEYFTETNGYLLVRWNDNNLVNVGSNIDGLLPMKKMRQIFEIFKKCGQVAQADLYSYVQ